MTAPRWSDADLAHLQADYENSRHADDHSDVVASIRGLRAVVALHEPITGPGKRRIDVVCSECLEYDGEESPPACVPWPCPTIRALNLEV